MAAGNNRKTSPMLGAAKASITTPTDCQIVITRKFDVPREVVFEAWTKPEHVTEWWDPSGAPLAVCEIDLRPGGRFRWINRGHVGEEFPFQGIYREIVAPERLVFALRIPPSSPESVATLTFTPTGNKTQLTITMDCQTREQRDALLTMRIDEGTARTLDNLAGYLTKTLRDRSL